MTDAFSGIAEALNLLFPGTAHDTSFFLVCAIHSKQLLLVRLAALYYRRCERAGDRGGNHFSSGMSDRCRCEECDRIPWGKGLSSGYRAENRILSGKKVEAVDTVAAAGILQE